MVWISIVALYLDAPGLSAELRHSYRHVLGRKLKSLAGMSHRTRCKHKGKWSTFIKQEFVHSKAPCGSMVYTWALKGLPYRDLDVWVSTIHMEPLGQLELSAGC